MSPSRRLGILSSAALTVGFCLCAPQADADVVLVSNETASIAGEMGGTLVGEAISDGATPFYLTSISAEIYGAYVNSPVSFSVYSRNADGTLGSLLDSASSLSYTQTRTTTPTIGPYPTGVLTASFSDYMLQANTSYWLVIATPNSPYINWEYTVSRSYTKSNGVTLPSADNSFYQYNGVNTYYPLSDGPLLLQVDGLLSVPEPRTLTLLGAGLAGLGVVRRRTSGLVPSRRAPA